VPVLPFLKKHCIEGKNIMNKILTSLFAVAIVSIAITALAVTTTTNYVGSATELSKSALDKVYVVENTVTITTADIGDIFKCIGIKPNSLVMAVGVEVVTPNTNSTAIVELGDAGSSTQYDASTALNAASVTVSPASAWEFYSAASDIRLTIGTAAATNVTLKVRAVIADLSK
jgi:hypothetical protein